MSGLPDGPTPQSGQHLTSPGEHWRRLAAISAAATALAALPALFAAPVRADSLGYLVNVTVRPGYNFANADAALSYGYQICEETGQGWSYVDLVQRVKRDMSTTDDYQASYLISQAIDQLCPNNLWQLRRSAAGYTPGPMS